MFAGPVSATVGVRASDLSIGLRAPGSIRPGATLPVSVDYTAEVERSLTFAFAQASSCGAASAHYVSVLGEKLSGAGHLDETASVPSASGR